MSYSTGNPPRMISEAGVAAGGIFSATALSSDDTGGGSIWLYRSTHSSSEVIATGFFTRASDLGMRLGDILVNFPQSSASSSKMTWHGVVQSSFGTTASTTSSTWGGYMNVTVASAT